MGAEENAAVVRRGHEAFNAGDMATLTELFAESASWHTPGHSRIAGDHQGRDAAFAQFGRYGGETGGTFRAELRDVLADDAGRVVGIHHNSAQRDGKQLDVDCCLVTRRLSGCVLSQAITRHSTRAFLRETIRGCRGPRWTSAAGALVAAAIGAGGRALAGCEPERLSQDRWLARFFRRDPAWTRHGRKLRLKTGDDVIAFRPRDSGRLR